MSRLPQAAPRSGYGLDLIVLTRFFLIKRSKDNGALCALSSMAGVARFQFLSNAGVRIISLAGIL